MKEIKVDYDTLVNFFNKSFPEFAWLPFKEKIVMCWNTLKTDKIHSIQHWYMKPYDNTIYITAT